MNRFLPFSLAILVLAPMCAMAELSVSVTITGDIEEIMPLLQHLNQMGAGVAPQGEDPLKLRMLSVHGDGATAEAPAVDPAAVEPVPADTRAPQPVGPQLVSGAVAPAEVSPGLTVLLTVHVQDKQRAVDTVTATFAGANFAVDLYDNGTNGDTAAADGTWSANVLVPDDLAGGEYQVEFAAYGTNGKALDTARTVATARVVRVQPAEARGPAPVEPAPVVETAPAAESAPEPAPANP